MRAATVAAAAAALLGKTPTRTDVRYTGRVLQLSLLASAATPSIDPQATPLPRRDLGAGAWLDVIPGWVRGADTLYEQAQAAAPWSAHRRVMWGKLIDEPRLSTRGWTDPPSPIPELGQSLSQRYGLDLRSVSANWYRDGQDSVAWHGDNSGRIADTTVVAVVSLGAPRRFLLRTHGGGPSTRVTVGPGDLLVMGGTCQRTFDHAIPKMANVGPRISLMFREPDIF